MRKLLTAGVAAVAALVVAASAFGHANGDHNHGGDPPGPCDDPTIVAGNEGDVVRGTAGPDVIRGSNGPDIIRARGGDDIVCGNRGPDQLNGGGDDDRLQGNHSADTLRGRRGDDRANGGAGGGDSCDAEREVNCEAG